MNIGEYVRTDRGNIFKIEEIKILQNDGEWFKSIIKENEVIKTIPSYDGLYYIESEKVYKSSPNIIDLIEVGDYVNENLVTSAEDVYTTDNIYIGKEVFVNHNELIIEEDIKSIVTKEQFESMEYKVKE